MSALFRTHVKSRLPADPNEARRPSHWNKELSEIEVEPRDDYPSEVDDDPRSFGFTPPPNPTPVYLTEPPPSDRGMVQWSAGNVTLDTSPDPITGADRRRKRMVCTNTGDTNTAVLTAKQEDLPFNGYLLEPNASVELFHNDKVWAYALANTTTLTWVVEYEVND